MSKWAAVIAALLVGAGHAWGASTALFYGPDVPDELIDVYDRVVVEPDVLSPASIQRLMTGRASLFAYVSVGELSRGARTRPHSDQIADWTLAYNQAWDSDVMDLADPGWRAFVIDQRVGRLWRAGFRGFFLDTLDSFRLAGLPDARAAAQLDGLVALIEALHARYPGIELIANRGFELLPRVAPRLVGLAAESLFDRWDPATRRYTRVPAQDRQWLLGKLTEARDVYRLPVTVIDYRSPDQREHARHAARRIAALGFDPWVTNADLTALGVGQPEVVTRRILVLHDGAAHAVADAPTTRLIAPLLEYQGYVPVYRDVRDRLPAGPLPGRYAGVVSWFTGPIKDPAVARRYRAWLIAALDAGVRVAAFGELGFALDSATLTRLGLARVARAPAGDIAIETSAPIGHGLEAAPRAHRVAGAGVIASRPDTRAHYRLRDQRGVFRDPVITGPWGGLALAPHILDVGYAGELLWVIDPFAFLREALALPNLPALDVTTENGHRVAMLHVDPTGGDQPAEQRGTPTARHVIRALLAAHPLPHSTTQPALAAGLAHVAVRKPALSGLGSNMTRLNPSLTRLRANAVPDANGALTIAPPIADEDGYRADDNSAPLGFRRVIETLELTDRTRRLKPIGIHYHAYSGAKPARRRALDQIYAWLAGQDAFPVYTWDYAEAVREFYRATVARSLDGRSFVFYGLDQLRTIRVPRSLGWPDLAVRSDVVAVRDRPQGRYVTLRAGPGARLTLTDHRPTRPIVIGANGRLLRFDVDRAQQIRLRVRGHVAITITVGGLSGTRCRLDGHGYRVRGRPVDAALEGHSGSAVRFDVPRTDTGEAVLRCQR